MKHLFHKSMTLAVKISTVIIAIFFGLVVFFTVMRKNDGEWNIPRYESVVEYQQTGGSSLDYYLGYKLLTGYDTLETSAETVFDFLYSIGFFLLLGCSIQYALVLLGEKRSWEMRPIDYIVPILLVLCSMQFVSYLIREGIPLQ